MPDLLLEFFSEEIPARMQGKAADDLKKLVTDRLVAAGLVYEGANAFATPRRLALTVEGIPARQPDMREEKKGPRVGAPDGAIQGFLRSAGLTSIEQAKIQKDEKKGEFYVATIQKKGRPAIEVIAQILAEVVKSFPWPKSMRWGEGSLVWVRPLHAIVATFGAHTEEPDIVPLVVDGIEAGDVTYGHRFMAPDPIMVNRFDDYLAKLDQAKVVLDPERRREIIFVDAKNLAFAQGFDVVEDPGLLHEVAGLVEWPVVLMGSFDEEFLEIPPEVIRATIRNNQKCFVLRYRSATPLESMLSIPEPEGKPPANAEGTLANKFILVANIEASDGGQAIVAGNERVIRARLSDAKFFYETDLKTPLEERLARFEDIIFHEKLGSQWARIERIQRLAEELAPMVDADIENASRAALLAKADLLTDMVGEFPELQGVMGKYYALAQGEDESVANASEQHYKPLGPNDRVPTDPVAIAVALADKIDMLTGFWAIDEKPTGSKDPYALRRAALGVIRIIIENSVRLRLSEVIAKARPGFEAADDLIAFFIDRLKVQLRDQGIRHDLLDAVLALGTDDDLVLTVRRVEALSALLETEDGKNLLAGYKRATNILRIEEKNDDATYTGAPDKSFFELPEERSLAAGIVTIRHEVKIALQREDFGQAMVSLAKLRPRVDAFFEKVTVNVEDKRVRENRLKLMNEVRETTHAVADFSRIEG